MDFPSTVESHTTSSDLLETNSAYIYAESIKGFDSCSTFIADSYIHDPNDRVDNCNGDFISVWNGLSQDYLYISGEDESSSNVSGCSAQAMAGSDSSTRFDLELFKTFIDIDSACMYTDRGTVTDYGCSIAEAVWGSDSSRSSDSSCCTTDRDSRQTNSSDSESPDVLSINGFEEIHFDKHEESFDSCDVLRPDTVEDAVEEINSQTDLMELEGVVLQTERCDFSDIFCKMIKEEKVTEKMNINEGFLFHPKQVGHP